MLLAILSDIHGNLPALEAVLAEATSLGVGGYIVAGDLIGGPHSNETTRILRSLNPWMIRGNTDTGLLQYVSGNAPLAWHRSSQFALMRWNYRHLEPEVRDFLCSLPEQLVVELPMMQAIRVVHGSPRHPSEYIFPDKDPGILEQVFSLIPERVLICGHTHLPWVEKLDDRLALNPGSIAGSLNGDTRAQWALLRWQEDCWNVELRASLYDLAKIHRAFIESGLLEEGGPLAKAFLLSIETGRNIGQDFLSFAHSLAREAGYTHYEAVPESVWSYAAQNFPWETSQY